MGVRFLLHTLIHDALLEMCRYLRNVGKDLQLMAKGSENTTLTCAGT